MNLDNLLDTYFTPDTGAPQKLEPERSPTKMTIKNLEFETTSTPNQNQFTAQYALTYSCRLRELTTATKSRALRLWPSLPIKNVSNLQDNQEAIIVGTIWKNVAEKISYLKTLETPEMNDLYREKLEIFDTTKSECFIEDETGRRKIEFLGEIRFEDSTVVSKASERVLVTGAVVGIKCVQDLDNAVTVLGVCLPGLVPQEREQFGVCPVDPVQSKSNPGYKGKANKNSMDIEGGGSSDLKQKGDLRELLGRIQEGYRPKLVAFISDLSIGAADYDGNLDDFELFVDWVIGMSSAKDLARCVNTVVVAGNLVKVNSDINLGLISAYRHEAEFNKMYADMSTATKKLDRVLSKVTHNGIQVNLLPGVNDTADSFLPQRPLAKLLFRESGAKGLQSLSSNPASFSINGVSLYGSSGENLVDLKRFTIGMDDPIDQMRFLLESRHWVPTAPYNLPSFPFQEEDSLCLKQTPRVVFCGCQGKGDSGFIARDDANVLILAIPKFSESKNVMLVDFNEMRVYDSYFGQPDVTDQVLRNF